MKEYKGFASLISDVNKLPFVGWVFVDPTTDRSSREDVRVAAFYIAEDDAEEILFEKNKSTFVECPTLVDIKSIADRRAAKPDLDAYLDATMYYIENDDFKD